MVTRREKVLLELEDHFTRQMIEAAGATALLKKELGGLSGTAVQTSRETEKTKASVKGLGDEVGRTGAKVDAGSKQIDRYSGRLRLLGEAAVILGPALVPIGAVAVPAVVALAGGLAAAAAGAGVAVLAFHGVGDALKALDAYQLDPSTAHLEKMREEFEKIGPTGVEFVKFLDGIEPQLKDLQEIARQGLFPGVEEGITSLLDMLPQVRLIVFDLATELGRLASQAGDALSGDRFSGFFDYLETNAAPTLEAFAHTLGNVMEALGSLLVAFAPLSRDFSSGMEAMSKSFADWAAGLSETQGFRDFVAYVRESGPQVLDLLGSLATAFIEIAQAAAPVGAAVLPALTALANILGAIAASPIGPPLFAAVAAMLAINRAATLVTSGLDKVKTSAEGAGMSVSTIGKGIVGITAVIGAANLLQNAFDKLADTSVDTGNLGRSLEALANGQTTEDLGNLFHTFQDVQNGWQADWNPLSWISSWDPSGAESAEKSIKAIDETLAQMVESGDSDMAAAAFANLGPAAEKAGLSISELKDLFPQYQTAIENSVPPADHAAEVARKLAKAHNQQAASADDAAESTASLVGAMQDEATAALGAFDAETQYREALKAAAAQAKKNEAGIRGNSKAALENRGALSSLAGAWNNQSVSVKNNVGRWKEAKGAFIDTAVAMGVPIEKAKALADRLMEIPKSVVIKQQNNMDPAVRTAKLLAAAIRNIPTSWLTNYTINTTRTGVIAGMAGGRDGDPSTTYASGGFTGRGARLKAAGVVHAGEVVLPQEIVRRDKSMLMARYGSLPNMGQLPGFATGGFAGYARTTPDQGIGTATSASVDAASAALFNLAGLGKKELEIRTRLLNKELERDQKAVDLAKQHRDAVLEDIKALRSSVAERFRGDVFGQQSDPTQLARPDNWNPTYDSNGVMTAPGMSPEEQKAFLDMSWQVGQIAQANAGNDPLSLMKKQIADAREARRLGRELAAIYRKSGGKFTSAERQALAYAQQNADNPELAALVSGQAQQYANLYGTRQRASGNTGQTAAFQRFGAAQARTVDELVEARKQRDETNNRLKAVEHELTLIRKENKTNSADNAKQTADGVNGAVTTGHRGRGPQ